MMRAWWRRVALASLMLLAVAAACGPIESERAGEASPQATAGVETQQVQSPPPTAEATSAAAPQPTATAADRAADTPAATRVALAQSPTPTPAPPPAAGTRAPTQAPSPTPTPEVTPAATPSPVPVTPTAAPSPVPTTTTAVVTATPEAPTATPSSGESASVLGLQPGSGTREESFGEFIGTIWRDVFESTTTSEQACIRGELGVARLSSVLQQSLLHFFTPPAQWHVDYFRCLEQETALRLLIFLSGEGWYGITENALGCAREALAETDISSYFLGVLPDADQERVEASRQISRELLACNVKPLRDSLRHSGPGLSKAEQLCVRTRFGEELVASLLGRAADPGSLPWQEQVLNCLGDDAAARLLFTVLPTEVGGVWPDQEDCVRSRFSDAEIAGGMLPRSNPDRATAVQALIDGLRECIPGLILAGEDAHPVDRRLHMFGSTDSSCINLEIGEVFLDLALGKPYRPNPDLVLTAQSCFVTPTAAAISWRCLRGKSMA